MSDRNFAPIDTIGVAPSGFGPGNRMVGCTKATHGPCGPKGVAIVRS